MQLLLVSKAKRFSLWVFTHLWALLKRIIKNPLGFIWWAFKMYIALMMLMFCILMSFGAIAQTGPTGTNPDLDYAAGWRFPTQDEITVCRGWHPSLPTTDPAYPSFTLPGRKTSTDCTKEATQRYQSAWMAKLNEGAKCPHIITKQIASGWMYQKRYWHVNNSTKQAFCANDGGEIAASVNSSVIRYENSVTCPAKPTFNNPDEDEKRRHFTVKETIDSTPYCFKPKEKPTSCPKVGDIQVAPIRHFDTVTTSDKVCVKNDKGDLCPFKKVSQGVFEPDTTSPNECGSGGLPVSDPIPPVECKEMQSGQRACRADPNQKCTSKDGKQTCEPSCGYVNNVFMCVEGQPTNTPLAPLNPIDDTITNPTKKTPDMEKSDYKDVMKGAEGRLDNVVTSIENLGKQLSDQKADGPTKSGQDRSNMYLSSIDKNVAEINKKLDGPGEDEEDVPLNPKELDFEHNDFETRNFGTVIDAAAKALLGKPIFMSIKSYFNASFGGSCPTWSVDVDVYTITIDQLCSETMNQVWPGIRAIIILVFSFLAFRVAFLD